MRLLVSAAAGAAALLIAWPWGGWAWGVLWALPVEGIVFAALTWASMWPRDADATSRHARRDEMRPALEEAIVVATVIASVAVTFAVGVVGAGGAQRGAALLALVGVLTQWFGLHAMYAARYAFEYYDDGPGTAQRAASDPTAPTRTREPGGIDFNDAEAPCYRDFLYFSYNLGMTYQVSDTSVTQGNIRAVVLRHCLLSFFFVLIIMATTISVATGVVLG